MQAAGEEYYVEEILEDRWNKARNRREWKVKWEGWSVNDCTWEPLENLENNVVFQAWCQKSSTDPRNRKRKRESSDEQRKKQKTSNLPPEVNFEPPAETFELPVPLPEAEVLPTPPLTELNTPLNDPPLEVEVSIPKSPTFQLAVSRLRKAINLASPRCQRCLGIAGLYDSEEDFLGSICFQPREAQLLLCQLIFSGHTTVRVTWKDPLVWFAQEKNATYLLCFPREERDDAEAWLQNCQDFSMPVIPISVRTCEENVEKAKGDDPQVEGDEKQSVHYALAYDFLNSAFVLAFEQGQYPAFRISHLDPEKVDLLLKETATLPADLEQFQLQSDLQIDTSSLLTYLRQDISDFLVRRNPPGFNLTEHAKKLAQEKQAQNGAEFLKVAQEKQVQREIIPTVPQEETTQIMIAA